MTKTLIIHNPKAGVKKKIFFSDLLLEKGFTIENGYDYIQTKYAGHASELTKNAIENGVNVVAIAGGDGSVNEVAKELLNSETSLAIIPMGSGNGLARHMKIPLDISESLNLLKKGNRTKVDVGDANGNKFFCASGIGFDAEVSKAFELSTRRGLRSYIVLGAKEYIKYKPKSYSFTIDQEQYNKKAFIISIANAAQFGNNAYISPKSKNDDGMLELCIIKPYPFYAGFSLFMKLFNKKIESSKYYQSYSGKKIEFELNEPSLYHCDGEVFLAEDNLKISIDKQILSILIP